MPPWRRVADGGDAPPQIDRTDRRPGLNPCLFPLEIISMRIMTEVLGFVLVLTLCGCGDSGVTEGSVPFKETNTSQFDEMKNQMMKNIKTKSYLKKPVAPKAEQAK